MVSSILSGFVEKDLLGVTQKDKSIDAKEGKKIMDYCPYCGGPLDPDGVYYVCPQCGMDLD